MCWKYLMYSRTKKNSHHTYTPLSVSHLGSILRAEVGVGTVVAEVEANLRGQLGYDARLAGYTSRSKPSIFYWHIIVVFPEAFFLQG